jgi:hypothetical protein
MSWAYAGEPECAGGFRQADGSEAGPGAPGSGGTAPARRGGTLGNGDPAPGDNSGGGAVLVDEAAKAITSSDRIACRTLNQTLRGSICAWRTEVECPVWSVDVVMIDVDAQDALEVSTISNEQPVEALRTHGLHESLGDGVRLGCAKRGPHDLKALAPEDLIEGLRELAVAVVDQLAGRGRCP